LDRVFEGDTESAASYSIYVDTYSLPSDFRRMRFILNERLGHPIIPKPASGQTVRNRVYLGGTSTTYPIEYTVWGKDSSDNMEIIFLGAPLTVEPIALYYWKKPTAVTGPGSTIDIPSYLEEVVHLHLQRSYLMRMGRGSGVDPGWVGGMMQENGLQFGAAMRNAISEDARVNRPKQINERIWM